MAYETIRYDVKDGIAVLTLSRPDKLNAFTSKMMHEMIDAMDRVDADDAVRALIVTGDGRAFCAGADLSSGASTFDFAAHGGGTKIDYSDDAARDGGGRVTLRIFKLLKPIIAAINGPAVGIGATMTLPMDIRLASDSARIGFVFSRRGIVPEACSSFFLPRIVGISQALQWCYSGKVFDAQEALRGGLVTAVHPGDKLLDEAMKIAREIADNTAPVSVALIRQMMWRGTGMTDPMQAHRVDSRGILSRGASNDVKEGVTSFLEKRPPAFPNSVSADMPDYFPWWDEELYR